MWTFSSTITIILQIGLLIIAISQTILHHENVDVATFLIYGAISFNYICMFEVTSNWGKDIFRLLRKNITSKVCVRLNHFYFSTSNPFRPLSFLQDCSRLWILFEY